MRGRRRSPPSPSSPWFALPEPGRPPRSGPARPPRACTRPPPAPRPPRTRPAPGAPLRGNSGKATRTARPLSRRREKPESREKSQNAIREGTIREVTEHLVPWSGSPSPDAPAPRLPTMPRTPRPPAPAARLNVPSESTCSLMFCCFADGAQSSKSRGIKKDQPNPPMGCGPPRIPAESRKRALLKRHVSGPACGRPLSRPREPGAQHASLSSPPPCFGHCYCPCVASRFPPQK